MTRTLLIAAALLGLAACETVDGAGQDIEKAGRFVQGTAQNVQKSL